MDDQANQEAGSDTATAEAVMASLTALETSGADRFDPVRFHFIRSIANRSTQQESAVAELLIAKAHDALKDYESRLSAHRASVALQIDEVVTQYPDLTAELARLLAANAFSAINGLLRRQPPIDRTDTLSALTELLHTAGKDGGDVNAGGSQELKSVRHFRDTLQRQHADKLVTHALGDAPQDAGPLNPQKLALRSLAIMREISPAYLGHFVSYLDTLFWLEKMDTLTPSRR